MVAAREPVLPPAQAVDSPPDVNREALSRLVYERYSGALLNFVVRLTSGDRQWAEDVVQETVLRAWRHADRLTNSDGGALLPWLVTVPAVSSSTTCADAAAAGRRSPMLLS